MLAAGSISNTSADENNPVLLGDKSKLIEFTA